MRWFKEGTNGNIESRIKYTNYFKNVDIITWFTMIHEKDYETMNCCLCARDGLHPQTHNPAPFTPNTTVKEAHENNFLTVVVVSAMQKLLLLGQQNRD